MRWSTGLIGSDGKAKADLGMIHVGTANNFARNLDLPTFIGSLAETFLALPGSYPKIDYVRTNSVRMDSRQRLSVQADGEVLGELPAQFRVLPKSLRVVA
jgi:diacylglycerol kinase family enzyme